MLTGILFAALFAAVFAADSHSGKWSYVEGKAGPADWGDDCKKDSQSPIDLVNPTFKKELTEIQLTNYDNDNGAIKFEHVGHSVVGTPNKGMTMTLPTVTGTWNNVQFHFHWGIDSAHGSEHTVAGKKYPMEMHIVHMNAKYPNTSMALANADGLAVLGFFFEVGSENAKFKTLINSFASIPKDGNSTMLNNFTMSELMLSAESMKKYYRYQGSLTTPPCSEAVTWTVFTDPIKVSEAQLAKFREVTMGEHMDNNYRPVQPLGQRTLYVSDETLAAGSSHVISSTLLLTVTYFMAKLY